ncbi:hypothetical protein BU14_0052s0078 [Porphyra umbilicalis]|uniref:Anaphase-promoting complex subunit 4 WD40 domain-containing protein n=1 Tax=Porphyra umbilicalis TaxID=2786 RepID=A0A1X6PI17_PORUM|nr:hypothetical protein BU14_0052s0078 [Porphyra umbilicalis]|eukprot:OSX80465.1 hypothetical protein BU14_0052s0078 [Porphyra umbilicalis]
MHLPAAGGGGANGGPSPPPLPPPPVTGEAGAHGAPIAGVAWLPDLTGGGAFATAGSDETVRLWSAAAAAAAAPADGGGAPPPALRGVFRSDEVATAATPFASVAAAAGDAGAPPLVAAGGTNGDVWVVDARAARLDEAAPDGDGGAADAGAAAAPGRGRKRPPSTVPALGGRRLDGGPRHLPVAAVAFGGADELAGASWDGLVRLWAVDAGVVRVTLPAGGKALTGMALAPPSAAGDGGGGGGDASPPPPVSVLAVTAIDGAVRLLDARVAAGAVVVGASPPRRGHAGIASAVVWTSAVGLATGGHDGAVAVWDVRSLAAPTDRLADAGGGGGGRGGGGRLFAGGSDGQVRAYRLGGGGDA